MRSSAARAFCAFLLLASFSTATRAIIINSDWNTASGNWNVTTNWDPADVPDNGSGKTHHVRIGSRPVAAGAVVTFIQEDNNYDTVSSMTITNAAEFFSNSHHLNVFGPTIVDGLNSKIRIAPHDNHHAEAFRSFDLTLTNGAALLLNDAAVTVDDLLDVGATSTVEGPGELVGDSNLADFYFRSGSHVIVPEMLHLDKARAQIDAGAIVSGAAGLHIGPESTLRLQHGAVVNVMVENEGALSIGDGLVASATVREYQHHPSAVWILDIAGYNPIDFDHLALTGDAHVEGALQIMLGSGYVPTVGTNYEFLSTAGDIMGEFSSLTQPAGLPPDLLFEVGYNEDNVQLVVVNSLPGDFNRDGLVDTADFVIFEKTAGQSVPRYSSADANGDTLINTDDYNIWRRNFGMTNAAGATATAATAPEPTTPILLLFACGLAPHRGRVSRSTELVEVRDADETRKLPISFRVAHFCL